MSMRGGACSAAQAVVDCEQKASMPDVTFIIAGREFTLTPEQYVLEVRCITTSVRFTWHLQLKRLHPLLCPLRRTGNSEQGAPCMLAEVLAQVLLLRAGCTYH